jgi:hypothetical protein
MFRCGQGTAPGMRRQILVGVLAGAAGTTALNAVTYLDMAVRGRPSSDMPEQAVERTASKLGARIPGNEETRGHRRAGRLTGQPVRRGRSGVSSRWSSRSCGVSNTRPAPARRSSSSPNPPHSSPML